VNRNQTAAKLDVRNVLITMGTHVVQHVQQVLSSLAVTACPLHPHAMPGVESKVVHPNVTMSTVVKPAARTVRMDTILMDVTVITDLPALRTVTTAYIKFMAMERCAACIARMDT